MAERALHFVPGGLHCSSARQSKLQARCRSHYRLRRRMSGCPTYGELSGIDCVVVSAPVMVPPASGTPPKLARAAPAVAAPVPPAFIGTALKPPTVVPLAV